ncbi:MFS transporter [Streptomyces kanamyceticus]|uniref:MFS transporter n=1 Tax=Streptomyces kanamyceticus TaxID=1967 RepID=A0A5J6GSV3_STRKN|nr:MFS transporter [Streptomyces kanamyceticus]QEU97512.1 MFS transporter [Streptomyces kanamyceticus]
MFLTGFAALAVVPTLPLAARDLDGVALYPLVAGCFVAASLLGGVLGGDWADRAGARGPLAAGVALAVATLLISAASTSIWQLAAGRFLDGLAAGMIAVAVNTAVAQTYPDRLRPRALSLMSTCWIIPSLTGPPLAGLVAEWWSWRAVFYGLAAVTVLPAIAVVVLLRGGAGSGPGRTTEGETADEAPGKALGEAPGKALGEAPGKALGEAAGQVSREVPGEVAGNADGEAGEGAAGKADRAAAGQELREAPGEASRKDADGVASGVDRVRPSLVVAAAVSVGAALGQYAASGWDLLHLLCGAGGFAVLGVFAARLLPPRTWRAARGLPASVLLRGLASGAFFTLEAFVPLYLVTERHAAPLVTGLAFTGAAVAWAAASWVQGHLLAGRPRHRLVVIGALIMAAAVALAALSTLSGLFGPGATGTALAASAMPAAAIGMGLLTPSLTLLSLGHSPPDRQGYASAAMQTTQNLGQVTVMAVASALFTAAGALAATPGPGYTTAFALLLAPSLLVALLAARAREA